MSLVVCVYRNTERIHSIHETFDLFQSRTQTCVYLSACVRAYVCDITNGRKASPTQALQQPSPLAHEPSRRSGNKTEFSSAGQQATVTPSSPELEFRTKSVGALLLVVWSLWRAVRTDELKSGYCGKNYDTSRSPTTKCIEDITWWRFAKLYFAAKLHYIRDSSDVFPVCYLRELDIDSASGLDPSKTLLHTINSFAGHEIYSRACKSFLCRFCILLHYLVLLCSYNTQANISPFWLANDEGTFFSRNSGKNFLIFIGSAETKGKSRERGARTAMVSCK